jgi:hypothetical protein
MLFPPPTWTNPVVRLYHGTTERDAEQIVREGVAVALGGPRTDFGPGFYTTTIERQAQNWAVGRARRDGSRRAGLVRLDIDRDQLARLDHLAFVRGEPEAEEFWSFVVHCRSGAPDHARSTHPSGFYDVVVGPVSAFWQQRLPIAGSDQISFHTEAAERVLNLSERVVSWTWSL